MKASHKTTRVDRELFPIVQGSVPNRTVKRAPHVPRMRKIDSVMPSNILKTTADDPSARPPRSSVWRDLALVFAITLLAAVLFATFDFSERAYRWTRSAERFQLDELPPTLLVLAAGCAWFAWRRYHEAQREAHRRRVLEEEAEHLLVENRRLASQAIAAQSTLR